VDWGAAVATPTAATEGPPPACGAGETFRRRTGDHQGQNRSPGRGTAWSHAGCPWRAHRLIIANGQQGRPPGPSRGRNRPAEGDPQPWPLHPKQQALRASNLHPTASERFNRDLKLAVVKGGAIPGAPAYPRQLRSSDSVHHNYDRSPKDRHKQKKKNKLTWPGRPEAVRRNLRPREGCSPSRILCSAPSASRPPLPTRPVRAGRCERGCMQRCASLASPP